MAISRLIIVGMVIAATLISLAAAIPGTATLDTPMFTSECAFLVDPGPMIAAANPDLYAGGDACARRYRVRCTGSTNNVPACRNGEVVVTIVNICPGCGPDQLELSLEAFSAIANPDAGTILIDYTPYPA